MSKKLRIIKDVQCTGKFKHADILSALKHTINLNKKEPDSYFGIYVCDFCSYTHIGHCKSSKRITDEPVFEKDSND